ncbi:MAG TPA: hypothetical protein QGH10_06050 [Armatimonadota bacterium]|nr:hypothetical protein [Armatimonadota bacterium]
MTVRAALILATAVLVAFPVATRADVGEWALANRHIEIRADGAELTHLAFDPAGKKNFGRNLIQTAGFAGIEVAPGTRLEETRDTVRLLDCDSVVPMDRGNETADVPALLHEGETFGQSFVIDSGTFTRIAVKLPTWNTTDSAATIALKRAGPGGDVIATRRAENVRDNSWQELTFDPQAAGTYYVELSELKGQLGWWSLRGDALPDGQAFADGQPQEGLERTIRITGTRPAGTADLTLALNGPTLTLQLDVTPNGAERPDSWPLNLVTYWVNEGYDVSKDSVPFKRFFSSSQRYFAVEQLKRSDIGGHLVFFGSEWIEAEGTDDYDLRFSGGESLAPMGHRPGRADDGAEDSVLGA